MNDFAEQLLTWFDEHGRHDLPWQKNDNPYRVWVSEIMLQQTQVKTVIPYYEKFMARFPTLKELALAPQEEVLAHWSGLGYYARARNLHKSAQLIVEKHNGVFPNEFDAVLALPGIGRSTAGAILSIAYKTRFAILDGNVKRVLSRFYAVEGWPGERLIEQDLWDKAEQLTPKVRFDDYTQAIMDLGATLCTRSKPQCQACPVQQSCQAWQSQRVSEFPFSKPKKKAKPIKSSTMLLLSNHQGEIWLQKRPQKGIWGGLWSFPEFDDKHALQKVVESELKTPEVSQLSLVEWETFRHTFSHYHLDISPVRLSCNWPEAGLAHGAWHGIDQAGTLGLPAPVKTLLNQLENEHV